MAARSPCSASRHGFRRLNWRWCTTICAIAAHAGCATADVTSESASDDLTSSTALAREMKFAGVVYVPATAGDGEILQAVRKQTQSAFGAFREATRSE